MITMKEHKPDLSPDELFTDSNTDWVCLRYRVRSSEALISPCVKDFFQKLAIFTPLSHPPSCTQVYVPSKSQKWSMVTVTSRVTCRRILMSNYTIHYNDKHEQF